MIFLFIPIAIVAPHGIVWEIIIGGLIGIYYNQKHPLENLPKPLTISIFAIPLWALLSSAWTNFPFNSFTTSLKVFALVILGYYWCRFTSNLSLDLRKSLIRALIGGLFIGVLFLLIETWLGNPWQTFWQKTSAKAFTQGSLMITLTTWPAILWVIRRPVSLVLRALMVICLFSLIGWTLAQIDCDTSFIGLIMGIGAFLGIISFQSITSWSMRIITPILITVFPLISFLFFKPEYIPEYNMYIHSPSYIDRLYIWNDVATSIFENPWKGLGIDGTRYHEKAHLIRNWSYLDSKGHVQKNQSARFGIHPHNVILQLWLELGFVGYILGIFLAQQILRNIFQAHLSLSERGIAAGLFTSTFIVVWVNVGFWQNWWISGLWVIVGLTLAMCKNKKESHEKIYNR